MKEILKGLLKLIVAILGTIAVLVIIWLISLILRGTEVIPYYIGEIFTLMLCIAGFALLLKLINTNNN